MNIQSERVYGLDVARALAVFGMMLVNFNCVFTQMASRPVWLYELAGKLDGRAAAVFILLAGIGVSLMTRRAGGMNSRFQLFNRAVFLFFFGTWFSASWQADILHFYGIYLVLGLLMLYSDDRSLIIAACASAAVSVAIVFRYAPVLDETEFHEYLWNFPSMVQNLFFDGIYPVFPWIAVFFIGMWLGRREWRDMTFRRNLLFFGSSLFIFSEAVSFYLVRSFGTVDHFSLGDNLVITLILVPENLEPWIRISAFHPTPLFLVSAMGSGFMLIAISLALADRFKDSLVTQILISAGRMSMTIYVAHIMFVINILYSPEIKEEWTILSSLTLGTFSLLFFCVLAHLWTKRWKTGPLETIIRAWSAFPFLFLKFKKSDVNQA